jgi:hypothetical protein
MNYRSGENEIIFVERFYVVRVSSFKVIGDCFGDWICDS